MDTKPRIGQTYGLTTTLQTFLSYRLSHYADTTGVLSGAAYCIRVLYLHFYSNINVNSWPPLGSYDTDVNVTSKLGRRALLSHENKYFKITKIDCSAYGLTGLCL